MLVENVKPLPRIAEPPRPAVRRVVRLTMFRAGVMVVMLVNSGNRAERGVLE